MMLNALHGDKLPVYGDGMQVRNWIYVEDYALSIGTVLERVASRRGLPTSAARTRFQPRGGQEDPSNTGGDDR